MLLEDLSFYQLYPSKAEIDGSKQYWKYRDGVIIPIKKYINKTSVKFLECNVSKSMKLGTKKRV